MIAFYWLIEVKGYRKWAFSLVVVEMNSIFIHSVGQVLKGGIDRAGISLLAQACTVLLVMWYLCYWALPAQDFL